MEYREELVVFLNTRNGLGIRILGTKKGTKESIVFIKKILDHGLAERDGRLKVGDQILKINDESSIGISREQAVNILRSAAATNQVRLLVRHFHPQSSSADYQRLLCEEKSTEDDEEDHRRLHNLSLNQDTHAMQIRKSSTKRRHHQDRGHKHRHSVHNLLNETNLDEQEEEEDNRIIKGIDVSHDALQALLNSKFQINDLVDLLSKTSPKLLLNDENKRFRLIEQLTQRNPDGRTVLKDFERQSSIFFGERVNLLTPFYSSSNDLSDTNNKKVIDNLHQDISTYRTEIDDLQKKITICEKSQRLAQEVEFEYENLIQNFYNELHQMKINNINQLKRIRANDQLIRKLFHQLSIHVNKPNDEQIIAQLKYEYEQQQKLLRSNNDSIASNYVHDERFE